MVPKSLNEAGIHKTVIGAKCYYLSYTLTFTIGTYSSNISSSLSSCIVVVVHIYLFTLIDLSNWKSKL